MKKLYMGLALSATLIVSGVCYSVFRNPTIDMTKLGHHYYSYTLHDRDKDNDVKVKVLEGNKNKLKVRIEFKELNRGEYTTSFLDNLINDKKISLREKNMLKAYFRVPDDAKKQEDTKKPKKEEVIVKNTITYNWVDEPRNIVVVKITDNIYKNQNGEFSIPTFKPFLDKDKISRGGTYNLYNGVGQPENTAIYGIRGSGIIDIEMVSIYK
ncbi:MAG: hypothetical protein RR515_03995 [Clostridium sp.]